MAQQTAVNWLIKNLMLNGLIRLTQDQHSLYKELTELAKEMDKQQKIYFFECGRQYQLTGEGTFTEVYNETYGGQGSLDTTSSPNTQNK